MQSHEHFERKVSIIEIFISAFSVILVLFTLFEMQADRNASYKPDVSISDAEVAIVWEGTLPDDPTDDYSALNFDSFYEQYNINAPTELMMYNIGVGTAKDISLSWNHQENVDAFIKAFDNYDDVKILYTDDMLYIETPKQTIGQGLGDNYNVEFMLNSTTEYHTVRVPLAYSYLIQELLIRNPYTENFPKLNLNIAYSDIQNKVYEKQVYLSIDRIIYTTDVYDNGFCLYRIHITEEDNMLAFGSINMDSDSISAICAVAAVAISIVSMVFTVIYSHKQNEHNRNSVRPISAIKFNDYEDQIAVKIENFGTGPLLIEKLRLIQDGCESETLISLMPNIDQTWTTFTEKVDGWTIPVGGSIVLIEINPKNSTIRTCVRKALSPITLSIDYKDIYSTKFHDERSLDFFGRHFE